MCEFAIHLSQILTSKKSITVTCIALKFSKQAKETLAVEPVYPVVIGG